VGHQVASALVGRGTVVIGTARTPVDGLHPLDVTDKSAVQSFFRSLPPPDAVVHLAAIAHPRRRRVPPGDYDRVNHLGLRHVVDAALGRGVRRVVFFSSSVVYGDDGRRGVTEDSPRVPVGPYACSKRDAEDACFDAMRAGADVVILRFPVIYGNEFLEDLRSRAYVPFTGNRVLLRIAGRQPDFSLCSIANAIDAVHFALEGSLASGVYNVADAEPYGQVAIRETVASIDGSRPTLAIPERLVSGTVRIASQLAPKRVADGLLSRHAKLFVGSTLDTTRIRCAGFVPRHRLQDLTAPAAPATGGAAR